VLGANYPGSKWYERAYNLVEKKTPEALEHNERHEKKDKKQK